MLRYKANIQESRNSSSRTWAILAQTASKFKCRILIEQDSKVVNAKSLMGVLSLASGSHEPITLVLSGDDENEAYAEITKLLKSDAFKSANG